MSKFLMMVFEFFKTGMFAVGGGLATIPFLKEISVNYGWYSLENLQMMINVAESTPGPIGINMSTYVGYSQFGVIGGIATTLALVAPSIIIITIIATILEKFKESVAVRAVFAGIKPAVVALIGYAVYDIFARTLLNLNAGDVFHFVNWTSLILYSIALYISRKYKKVHPMFIIFGMAFVGIILQL